MKRTEEEEDGGCGFRRVRVDEGDGVWAAWAVGGVGGEDGSEVGFGGDAGWHVVSCFPAFFLFPDLFGGINWLRLFAMSKRQLETYILWLDVVYV